MRKWILASCTNLALAVSSTVSAQGTIAFITSETKLADGRLISYQASCGDILYALSEDIAKNMIVLRSKSDKTVTVDLTNTPFGSVLLEDSLVGKMSLGCAGQDLSIHFVGYRINQAGPMQPVRYQLQISRLGQSAWKADQISEENDDIVRRQLIKTRRAR